MKGRPVLTFYVLTLAVAWSGWIPAGAAKAGVISLHMPEDILVWFQYAPSIAAVVLTGLYEGHRATLRLLASAGRWRVGVQWYGVVLLLTPVIALAAIGVEVLQGLTGPPLNQLSEAMSRWSQGLAASEPSIGLFTGLGRFASIGFFPGLLVFALFAIANGGLSEEFGWRGFALPRLMRRMGPVRASVVVALLWTVYHTDMDFWQLVFLGKPIAFALLLPNLVSDLPLSVLMTWVYLRTGGSLLLPILFHASYNATMTALQLAWGRPDDVIPPFSGETVLGLWVVALILVVTRRLNGGRGPVEKSARLAEGKR